MPRILPLPADAISQIHSSKNITSLQDVVLALLGNSLDANATKVEITVDFRRGGCIVSDDGDGISSLEFGEHGGLGKMYRTSKRQTRLDSPAHELHGSSGTYLASLASLSFLSVTSRLRDVTTASSLLLHQGKVIGRETPTATDQPGTEVVVRDLFGNMPVRVKQRALSSDTTNNDDKAWHELRRGIVALLLAWPKPCVVRLADSNKADRKIQLAGHHPSITQTLTSQGLRQLDSGRQATFGIRDALPVIFQALLAPQESRASWVPVSASAIDISVKGLICLDPAPTKQCQFVSVGVRPCSRTSGAVDLYDAINKIFANSSFGSAEDFSDIDETERDRRARDRRYKANGYTHKQLHGRKGVERWPRFVLSVKFRDGRSQPQGPDGLSEAGLKDIMGILEATVTQWLSAHHFRPRKKRARRRNEERGRPASASSTHTTASSVSSRIRTGSDAVESPGARSTGIGTVGIGTAKRRMIDLSERPRSVDQIPGQATVTAGSPFNAWSRIKVGKSQGLGKSSSLQRATIAPEGRGGSAITKSSITTVSAFKLPAIEAGALNSCRRRHAAIHPSPSTPDVRTPGDAITLRSSDDFGSIDDDEMMAIATGVDAQCNKLTDAVTSTRLDAEGFVDWIDPRSKQKFKVNTRTGVVIPALAEPKTTPRDGGSATARQRAAINTAMSSKGKPLSLAKRPPANDAGHSEHGDWLPGFLREWDNPVFLQRDEQSVPVAQPEGPQLLEVGESSKECCGRHRIGAQDFTSADETSTGKLTKAGLQRAQVVSQVDRKFILCKMPGEDPRHANDVLALIDQHAASERVILEDLLADTCSAPTEDDDGLGVAGVKTTRLDKPPRFEISAQESGLFDKHRNHFADWGILYTLSQHANSLPPSQDVRGDRKPASIITVTHLSPSIAERCVLVPRILIEMLRAEIWSDSPTARANPPLPRATDTAQPADPDRPLWLQRIGSCPRGIIEMLNSRACRSAVMFNDVLSVRECGALVERLGRCVFPFMCAHGRVSMVPLAGLGGLAVGHAGSVGMFSEDGKGARAPEPDGSFKEAFGRWKTRSANDGVS